MGLKTLDEERGYANNEIEWQNVANYARDTEGLGNKGIHNVNVAIQCDIKISNQAYRNL
jgi:hypothetical protein